MPFKIHAAIVPNPEVEGFIKGATISLQGATASEIAQIKAIFGTNYILQEKHEGNLFTFKLDDSLTKGDLGLKMDEVVRMPGYQVETPSRTPGAPIPMRPQQLAQPTPGLSNAPLIWDMQGEMPPRPLPLAQQSHIKKMVHGMRNMLRNQQQPYITQIAEQSLLPQVTHAEAHDKQGRPYTKFSISNPNHQIKAFDKAFGEALQRTLLNQLVPGKYTIDILWAKKETPPHYVVAVQRQGGGVIEAHAAKQINSIIQGVFDAAFSPPDQNNRGAPTPRRP